MSRVNNSSLLKYLSGYSPQVLSQVEDLIDSNRLADYLLKNILSPIKSQLRKRCINMFRR